MKLELSVGFEITLDEQQVRLVTTGHPTETNQRALYPVIRRAYTLASATEVVIDLTSIKHLEGAALDLLCWEVEQEEPGRPVRPGRFALTEPRPTSGLPPPTGTRRIGAGPPPGRHPARTRSWPTDPSGGFAPRGVLLRPMRNQGENRP